MHRLESVLHPDALERWFIGARVTAIEHDRVIVTVPGADIALKLASYRGLISRRMSEALGRTVDVVFQATRLSTPPVPPANPVQQSTQVYSAPVGEAASARPPEKKAAAPPAEDPAAPSSASATSSTGPANRQIWALALQDLQHRMSGATFAVWIRPAELLAIDPDGTVVIGARNRVQRERLEHQHLSDLVIVLGKILNRPVGVRVVMIGEADDRGVGEQRGA